VQGDASETGVVKFVQPIHDIEETREKYPVFSYLDRNTKAPTDCAIPFSSEIKFNMFIRDMAADARPGSKQGLGDLMVIMKGAPERILSRCTKILINGEEKPYDLDQQLRVKVANDSLGKMGERVLAVARYNLEPEIFTKDPAYNFDVKTWKQWKDVKQRDPSIAGWFPMFGLTLVGLISLNDPPRPKVDQSVLMCKEAGVKVIMVTGDQPPTAAAIAHKVNIISDPTKEYNYMVDELKMDKQLAWEQCRAIVIHGDLLAEKHAEEENLDENDPEKGRFLMEWISKPEVVFARTTPSQKLLIVDACQRSGHVVAVTGDGVNDSPAIKKADIGVAMGSGSDVAKGAADILLLTDDFSSITLGVQQGRVMFDNLKKSINYSIAVNIPEMAPVVVYALLQTPMPLSAILMVAICVGTDLAPAISLAYENAELDIMKRPPRHPKLDHLVTARLMSFAYLQIGMLQACAGMLTYFWVMNDYGIKVLTTLFLNQRPGFFPNGTDVYDPNQPNFGNTNFGDASEGGAIVWGLTYHSYIDIRLFYTNLASSDWAKCRWDPSDESVPKFYRISTLTQRQICYTPEALLNAQTAYFVAAILVQVANNIISRTRFLSIGEHSLHN
jgi:sodium/potassium-transporting ATPase subunit alpha